MLYQMNSVRIFIDVLVHFARCDFEVYSAFDPPDDSSEEVTAKGSRKSRFVVRTIGPTRLRD